MRHFLVRLVLEHDFLHECLGLVVKAKWLILYTKPDSRRVKAVLDLEFLNLFAQLSSSVSICRPAKDLIQLILDPLCVMAGFT